MGVEVSTKAMAANMDDKASRSALHFVLLVGVLSLFADFTHEGSCSILGPYRAAPNAGETVVGIGVFMGLGDFLGDSLQLVSGRLSDLTGRFWNITIVGYALQMAAVLALTLNHSWPAVAVLIGLERIGKAIRNRPRDVMLSHCSGKTNDSFMTNFAVEMGGGQINAGSVYRREKVAKYNRPLEIARELGRRAGFGR